jgi:CheY-like chemotaxis protein
MTSDPAAPCILLVEDDDIVRVIAEETLATAGYNVVALPDGVEAMAAMSRVRPHLIVSDVRMPRCDGFELLQWVRRHPDHEWLPFIIVSAKADTSDLRAGMSLGADDYVTKPYLPEDLLRTVAVRLERAAKIEGYQRQMREFLAGRLPHDLRSPLTGIIGYTELMIAAGEAGETIPPEQLLKYARNLQLSGRRLLRLAENLALWSELEKCLSAAGNTIPPERSDFRIVASELNRQLRECAEHYGRGAEFISRIDHAVINAGSRGLVEVLRHLVDNAFKFSLPGTMVEANGRAQDGRYIFEVTDRGRGIKPDLVASLDQPVVFGRTAHDQRALGMGLILVRGFAKISDGLFEVFPNTPAAGITARLSLPLATAHGRD